MVNGPIFVGLSNYRSALNFIAKMTSLFSISNSCIIEKKKNVNADAIARMKGFSQTHLMTWVFYIDVHFRILIIKN